MHKEHIAFVPRAYLEKHVWLEQGFVQDHDHTLYKRLHAQLDCDVRDALEIDPSRKQLIPYVIIAHKDRIFTMRRTRKQTEARLHDQLSIGVGGHIDMADVIPGEDAIYTGMMRELFEEVCVTQDTLEPTYQGLLNDDSSEVGRMHMGVVYTLFVHTADVRVLETEKMEGFWLTVGEALAQKDRMESWSAMLLDQLHAWF